MRRKRSWAGSERSQGESRHMPTTMSERRWTAQYPELGTGPVPIEPCISPEYFQRERERIFHRVWLNVGREEEIPQAGDYFVKEIEVCNSSIIVTRSRGGAILGFHNMCAHRGNKLTRANRGHALGFVCGFHGWT